MLLSAGPRDDTPHTEPGTSDHVAWDQPRVALELTTGEQANVTPASQAAARDKLGSISGTIDGHPVSIDRHDAPSEPIDPSLPTWLVIHGNNSAPTTSYINALAGALHSASGGHQVLTLDWSEIAALLIWTTESYIIPVAEWASEALTSHGFSGDLLNPAGHSFGAYVASEMAERIAGGVNTIVGLDPAANWPGGYDPHAPGQVDFAAFSAFSWAFSDAGGFYGSSTTPGSADEAFAVKSTGHSTIVDLFSNMLNGVGDADVLKYFLLSRLLGCTPGPWVPNQYNHSGNPSSSGTYEAVITADSAGTLALSIDFFWLDDDYEENDTLGAASDPENNGGNWQQTWLSSISGPGVQLDDDWYQIAVAPGHERVLVDCRFTHDYGNIDVALHDSSGSLLALSDSTTDNEYIDCVVPGGGTYYVKVYYGGAGNSYDLWWDAQAQLDFGDAPDPTYPTLLASNGARHVIGGPWLGDATDAPDAEPDGQPDPNASGDDNDGNDDEDGVSFPAALVPGDPAAKVDVDMTGSSVAGKLNAWIDFNADGDWTDPGEKIFTDRSLASGAVHNLTFAIPYGAAYGTTYARFRVNTAGGLLPTGLADDGEVEDYEVELEPATIADRHIFYDNCHWDGNTSGPNDSGGPSAGGDDGAIATDKWALLPGQTATFANYTSYGRGINGITVDIQDPADPDNIDASDFIFKVGNDDDPSGWSAAPGPTSITVRPPEGPRTSHRITIIWNDNNIENEWLETTVKATAHTGLAAQDVFYWGNVIGEVGDSAANANVLTSDLIAIRDEIPGLGVPIQNRYDIDRDGRVLTSDLIACRDNIPAFVWLIHPPGPSEGLGEVPVGVGGGIGKGKPLDLYYLVPRTAPADPYPAGIEQTKSSRYSPVSQAIERQESRRVDFLLADALWRYDADVASADEDAEEPLDADAVDELFALY